MRMMMGLTCTITTGNLEQCHSERLQLEMIPKRRRECIIAMARIGETYSRQNQVHHNEQIHNHSLQHRLYTHAHNIRRRIHNCKYFKNVPFTRSRTATGIFTEEGTKLILENYICRSVEDMDGRSQSRR